MLDKLSFLEDKYKDLSTKIIDPEVMSDMDQWQKLVKEHAEVEPIVFKYREYMKLQSTVDEDKEMLKEDIDDEMKELLKEEIPEAEAKMENLEDELRILLLPKDPNDHKNVIVEIRAGAGGDEAGIFAGNLFRMYTMFADSQGWKSEVMSSSSQGIGGYKEVIFMINGNGAYSKLKYESGVHRVQRVPETESSGRIHTSTATVAVLPEAEDVDIEISQNDLRIDTYRSSGNGGQSVNTTDSAIRITHLPTGLVVSCQDEKSQHKNRDKALRILKTRLYDQMLMDQHQEIAAERKSQVGTGDRSERIRTYNYPQGRITDHRIGKTLYQLEDFLNGDIEDMIDSLITTDQAEKLKMLG